MELALEQMRACERDWALAVRQDTALLDQIHRAVGGPFHLIYPDSFAENLTAFQTVLRDRKVTGQVYFGKKANKAGAWLREVARLGGSVDVASVPEFVHALANGITGEYIGVTGAAKSTDLLWLASRHGAIVAIDALDELERAIALAKQATVLHIMLRILPPTAPNSRFGLNQEDLRVALQRCQDAKQHVVMEGFSFHLDGYAVKPRAEFASALIDQCLEAQLMGLKSTAISIGGGFACSYVSQQDWKLFQDGLAPTQFHADKSFSHFYPYFQAPTGSEMLDAILNSASDKGSLTTRLREHQIRLFLEPGRALLDGAGLSVFPVHGFKQNDEHGIITVAGLSMSLSEQWKNSEFLPSPVLVQRGPERPQETIQAAIGGSSCMEYDVLTWRKVAFPARPRHGDFVIYPNTAGYQMDKNESEFHQLPLPPKIVISPSEGRFVWRMEQ